jgi:DNA-binding response OmpR family regulator
MSISSSPTLNMLAGESDPTAPAVGFTFRAAWPDTELGSAAVAIGELLDTVRSMVSKQFRGAQTTSAVIVAPATAVAAPASIPATTADLVVDRFSHRVLVSGSAVDLTLREFELLAYLVGHPERVLTREQLLAAVWNHVGVTVRTVDVHVARLRRKLSDAAVALQTVRGVGYRWRADAVEVLVVSA